MVPTDSPTTLMTVSERSSREPLVVSVLVAHRRSMVLLSLRIAMHPSAFDSCRTFSTMALIVRPPGRC